MPSGDRPNQPGYALLVMLVMLSMLAAGTLAATRQWTSQAQRERERELVFRAEAIRRAIQSYVTARPEQPRWPTTLDDLLQDRRFSPPLSHLRRLYADPFTGQPDWVLMAHPAQPANFYGVHSRSQVRSMNRELGRMLGAEGDCVCGWRFAVIQPNFSESR